MPLVPFLLLLLALPLVSPAAAVANTGWFVSSPGGALHPGPELASPDGGRLSLAQELEWFVRREPEPLPVDLSRFQMVGDSGPLRLQVGLQSVPAEGLLLSDTARQGFSLHLEGEPRKVLISGFVLQSEAETIEGDALGLSNGENRLGGILGEITPLEKGAVQLRLSAGLVGGTRPGPQAPQKGEAWSMAAEAEVGSKLLLRGEFAASRYDDGPVWDAQQGTAATFLARYGSVMRRQSARPVEWHIGVENSVVDPGFHSLGNAALVSDRERVRLFGGGRRDRLRLTWHLNRDRNNLEQESHRITTGSSDYAIALHYHHREPLWWLGTPRHALIYDRYHRRPIDAADDMRYGVVDDERTRVQYRVDFSRRNWEWGVGYRFTSYEDNTAPWRDADERSVNLRAETRIAQRLFLAPFAEFGYRESGGEEYRMHRWGLKGDVTLVPEWLRGGWNAQFAYRELPARRWERSTSFGGNLVCTLRPPTPGRPGLSLSLDGQLRSWEYEHLPTNKEYRLFLNLRSTLG